MLGEQPYVQASSIIPPDRNASGVTIGRRRARAIASTTTTIAADRQMRYWNASE